VRSISVSLKEERLHDVEISQGNGVDSIDKLIRHYSVTKMTQDKDFSACENIELMCGPTVLNGDGGGDDDDVDV
jgi:hypothetical protein